MPPDVALLLPDPADGELPVLKPPVLPVLVLVLPVLLVLELPAAGVAVEPADVLPDVPDWLVPVLAPAACRADPGRSTAMTPAAAIPPVPAMAVSERTTDRPRSLAARALATLLRFMTIPLIAGGSPGMAGEPDGSTALGWCPDVMHRP